MYKEDKEKYVILNIGEETKNVRIDKYLSNLKELNISREKIKKGILSESILLNLKKTKNSSILKTDNTIYIEKELLKTDDEIRKENQDKKYKILKNMDILKEILKYDDEYIAVINKPKGLIVHKGSGTEDITLR